MGVWYAKILNNFQKCFMKMLLSQIWYMVLKNDSRKCYIPKSNTPTKPPFFILIVRGENDKFLCDENIFLT